MFQNLDLGDGGAEAFDSALEFLESKGTLEREINAPGSVLKPFAQLLSEILLPKIRNPETKVEQEEANSAINGTQGSSTSAKDKEKKAPVSLSAFLGLEEVRETQSPHACDHCDKRFELQWDLHVHLKKVHSIESYHACQQCPRVFTRREDFERHLITHGERNFKCRVCGMAFLRLETLDRHAENHHDLLKEIANNSLNIISSLSLGEKESETQQRKVDSRASTSSCVQSLASIHNDNGERDGKVALEVVAKDGNELDESEGTVCPDDDNRDLHHTCSSTS
ncbi:unnamed protein product [Orchesella dallaii]|uniref:C2H2-type domain-containing protein n=1 Tax=Orchesella dallaii TaxID=48710 RepID=A0ABP1Q1S7_9HEXA